MTRVLFCVLASGLLIYIVLAVTAIRVVPENRRIVVFRLGRFYGQFGPGVVLTIPVIDKAIWVDLSDQERHLLNLKATTRDGRPVSADLALRYKVSDAKRFVLNTPNVNLALEEAATQILDDLVGGMAAQEIASRRQLIDETLHSQLSAQSADWGVTITRATLNEISLPSGMSTPLATIAGIIPQPGTLGTAQATIFSNQGTVDIQGQPWAAISAHPIAPGRQVRVTKIILEVEDV